MLPLAGTTGIVCAAALVSLPACLAAQSTPADSVIYELSPASRLEVSTAKAGLLGFAGHEHRIRARAFSGSIVYYPTTPSASHLEIVVLADQLEVLTPPDTAEIRKVTEAMRTDVLDVVHHREIRFASTAVTLLDRSRLRVEGKLTLVGVTRDVSVEMELRLLPDTLRAAGSFAVKQSDFGIRPYRGGPMGTVRVADRVTFDLDAVAIRSRPR